MNVRRWLAGGLAVAAVYGWFGWPGGCAAAAVLLYAGGPRTRVAARDVCPSRRHSGGPVLAPRIQRSVSYTLRRCPRCTTSTISISSSMVYTTR